jgi:hypothetical protein
MLTESLPSSTAQPRRSDTGVREHVRRHHELQAEVRQADVAPLAHLFVCEVVPSTKSARA